MEKKTNLTRNFHLETFTSLPKSLIKANIFIWSESNFAQFLPHSNTKFSKGIIVLFLVLGFSITHAVAQRDQITTQAGEKIRCRILDETPNRFIYAYLSPTGKVLRNEIFKNLVSEFKYNFYPSDIAIKGTKMPEGLGNVREENTTAQERVDTKKGEQANKQSNKDERRTKEIKKPEEKIAESEESKKVTKNSKENEKKTSNSPKIDKKEEKSAPKTVEKTKKSAEKESEKPSKEVVKTKETKVVTPINANAKKESNEFSNYLKWRIGARGGFGNMLAKIDTKDEFGLYQEKLLRGWTWGADASYFFSDHVGIGLMFNNFQSQNKAENIKYRNILLNEDATGSISNKRSTKFVGPVLYFRKNIDFKTMVVLGLAPGAYFYNDKGTYDASNYNFKGLDFGAAATLGVDFLLGNDITGRDIILSLEAGYNYGKMRALDLGGGNGAVNLSTPIDLSRVDFTIGLRFTRYPKYLR
ncbi:hypothetical protein [Emticicia sp. SJ17W-69]|uniref:hypothetical protein n=1 Tax=Emticicia sp. SJ17W-69 TaxID=3421657 RepID=UPI003EBB4FF6